MTGASTPSGGVGTAAQPRGADGAGFCRMRITPRTRHRSRASCLHPPGDARDRFEGHVVESVAQFLAFDVDVGQEPVQPSG
jgi:hypothetical protein